VLLDGADIYAPQVDVSELRKRVGMVFQRPNPFPLSVFDNVAFGLVVAGERDRRVLAEQVERSLTAAWLWDQLRDRLDAPALGLPLDQQQRLCIARLIAVQPEVILMDEPCSALDPIATARIEELMQDLKHDYTIVIVTHNMQQASRVSDYTAFLYLGRLIEYQGTEQLFIRPSKKQTEDYITGRFG
jgi:phosphate transport system ATP-binding protein